MFDRVMKLLNQESSMFPKWLLMTWRKFRGEASRPVRRTCGRVTPPRLRLESLEDRTLLSGFTLGVTFTTGGNTSNEIAVDSYSWGGSANVTLAATGQQQVAPASLQDFQLVLSPGSAEPDVWGVLAHGVIFNQVTVHARKNILGTSFEYLTYKLSDAVVSSYQTASPGGVQDVITLSFTKIEEDFTPQNKDGSAGTPVTVTYDRATVNGGTDTIAAESNPGATSEPLGVTFTTGTTGTTGANTSNEIAVDSYSWGGSANVTLAATGQQQVAPASLQDFQLVLSPGSAEPDVWGVLAHGVIFNQVTVHARKNILGTSFEYLTYKLSDAVVSSYQTASPGGVQDVITLSFTKIEEDFTPQNKDGSAGTPVTVTYDRATVNGGTDTIAAESNPGATSEPLGVTFTTGTTGANTSNEIAVDSYSWGGSANVTLAATGQQQVAPASLQDFQLVLSPGSAEPDVWGVLAHGVIFNQVTVHARKNILGTSFEYLTYKLSDAVVSSYQTASPGGVQDVITLSFTKIEEDFTPQNKDGSAGTPVTVTYDRATVNGGTDTIAAESNPGATSEPLGVTFTTGTTGTTGANTSNEIAVDSYS